MGLGTLDAADVLYILLVSPHRLKFLAVFGQHVFLVLPSDLGKDVVLVFGSLDLMSLDWLHPMLVVVDVPLTVDGLSNVDLLDWLDGLLNDGRSGLRADLGRVTLVAGREEVLDVVHCAKGWNE